MTNRERVKIAMQGGMPDRVPVFPVITDMHTTYRYGIPMWQTGAFPRLKYDLLEMAVREYGFDGFEAPIGPPLLYGRAFCVKDEGGKKYLYDNGIIPREEIAVETKSGIKRLHVFAEEGKVRAVRVDMGPASFDPASLPVLLDGEAVGRTVSVAGGEYAITCVSMGNPHCVLFTDPDAVDIEKIGPKFECDPLFPERVNTEFVKQTGARSLRMRVWERGSGETLACGTGACAAAAAAVRLGLCPRGEDISVQLSGGELMINVGDTVTMTGEAVLVFKGEIEL